MDNIGSKVLNIQANDRQIIPSDTQASVFWIPNPLNNFTNNVAGGGTFGFWFVMPPKPNGKSTSKYANDPNMSPRQMPLGRFENNVAHSNRDTGIMVDEMQNMDGTIQGVANPSWTPQQGPYNSTVNGAPIPGVFKNILAFKNREHGLWFRASDLWFYNIYVFDNRIGFQAITEPGTLQNSLFVCETNNAGYFINPGWNGFVVTPRARVNIWSPNAPIYGYQNYDAGGPQFQNNNTFRGCFSNQYRSAAAISSLENAHNILFPQNRYQRIKFDDGSQRFFFQRFPNAYATWQPNELDSPKFVYVHDVDGTVTGNVGTWLVPSESYHTYGLTGCVANTTESGQRCSPFYEGFGYLDITNLDLANTDSSVIVNATYPWTRANWYYFGDTTKSNGIGTTGENPGDVYRTEYRTNFIARRGIMVQLIHPMPPKVSLMYTAAAPGDWVVVGMPYPAGTISVARTSWPAANFTLVNSVNELVADTYYYANNVLYVRLENTLSYKDITSSFDGGFVYQSSWNNQVTITHSCSGASCATTASVPAALPSYESIYKVDLCPSTGTSNTYGVAFLGFDIRTKILSYQIYHGKATQSSFLKMGGFDLGIPYSPAEGVFYPSYNQYVKIYTGTWKVEVNELNAFVGCFTSKNPTCVSPPAISIQTACSIPQDNFVVVSASTINNINGNPIASWSNWSWKTTISTSTDSPCVSQSSMQIITKDGALSMHNNNNGIVVPSSYFFQFWVKAVSPQTVTLTIGMTVAGASQSNSVDVKSKYINHWAITDETWTRVKIPLTDFGYSVDTNISRIDISPYQSWTLKQNQTFLLTDVRFVSSAVSDPTGIPGTYTQSNYVANNCYSDPSSLVSSMVNVPSVDTIFNPSNPTLNPSAQPSDIPSSQPNPSDNPSSNPTNKPGSNSSSSKIILSFVLTIILSILFSF